MAADAAVSAGVVVGALAMLATGAAWIDPVMSLVIAAFFLWNQWGLLIDAVRIRLPAVRQGLDRQAMERKPAPFPGVPHVPDLHIGRWTRAETCLTVYWIYQVGRHR